MSLLWMGSNICSLSFVQSADIKTIIMKDNKTNQRDLESGDNPEERKKTAGKVEKNQVKQNNSQRGNSQRDLESGDNPEEREKMSGN